MRTKYNVAINLTSKGPRKQMVLTPQPEKPKKPKKKKYQRLRYCEWEDEYDETNLNRTYVKTFIVRRAEEEERDLILRMSPIKRLIDYVILPYLKIRNGLDERHAIRFNYGVLKSLQFALEDHIIKLVREAQIISTTNNRVGIRPSDLSLVKWQRKYKYDCTLPCDVTDVSTADKRCIMKREKKRKAKAKAAKIKAANAAALKLAQQNYIS